MSITNSPHRPIKVNLELEQEQEEGVKAFLRGAVYTWCTIKQYEPFCAQDLLKGDLAVFQDTPLEPLFQEYGYDAAWSKIGNMLYNVIYDDHRVFVTSKDEDNERNPRRYRLSE